VSTFFDEGGMQIQYNVVDADTLRQAQATPEEFRDLVVRVAGFSAYFVELCKDLQDDLIKRTDITSLSKEKHHACGPDNIRSVLVASQTGLDQNLQNHWEY
jgi:hypothetical protein